MALRPLLVAALAAWTLVALGRDASALVASPRAASSAAVAQGQQDPQLRVQLMDPVLKLGDGTSLLVEVPDRQPDSLVLPRVEGLTFGEPRGPSVYRGARVIGGRTYREEWYTYRVPVDVSAEGRYEIPPVVAVFGVDELEGPALVLEVVKDERGDALGWLQVDLPFDRVVVGQTFPVEIEFGCRASLAGRVGAWDLTLPWISLLGRDAVEWVPPSRREGTPTELTIDGTTRVAASAGRSRVVDGETYRVMRLRLMVTPMRSGSVELSGTVLRFSTGRWVETFLAGREFQVTDEFFKRLSPRDFEVHPLPDAGRPIGFTGAVGSFEARARLDTSQMFVGDSFKLVVEYTGAGNLADFGAPVLELSPAFAERFAVYGTSEEREPDLRRVVYDLAPLTPEVDEVPPVELWSFDPLTWEYRVVATEPQPIDVRARGTEAAPTAGGATPSAVGVEELERDLVDVETKALRAAGLEGSAPRDGTLAAVLGALVVAWLALRLAARREGGGLVPVAERRRALRRLERELARSETPEQDLRAWAAFLASRSGERPEAWIGRDVRGQVRRRELDLGEVTCDLIARTSEHLEAAAYGDDPRVRRDELVARARDLLEEGL